MPLVNRRGRQPLAHGRALRLRKSSERQAASMISAGAFVLAVFGALIVGLSSWGVLFPADLVTFVRTFMQRSGSILVAVAVRILLAALLWITAPASHTPAVFKVLTGVALFAALVIAIAGSERISRLIEYVESWPELAVRLQCLAGVAFGLFLIWSVSPVWTAA